jgi:plastocyanin
MNPRLGFASALALGTSLILASGVSAQTPMSPHPAHIHAGSCPKPGDVVAGLSDVSFDMDVDGTASADAEPIGQDSAIPVEASITTVPMALAGIVAGQYAIDVHASSDDQAFIACGDIGGIAIGEADLPIGLGELNDSGASGVALLHANGDGTTTVSVFIVSPAAATDVVATEAIAIKGFAFAPASLHIGIGTTVTWTNEDGTQHTATAADGSFDSGALALGDGFSHTFDTAGTFDYACTFHRNMTATGDGFSHAFDTAGTFDYACTFHRNMTATITVG